MVRICNQTEEELMLRRIVLIGFVLSSLLPSGTVQAQGPGPERAGPYWTGEYYDNRTLSGSPSLARDDAKISFSWGSGSPATGQIDTDVFSVRWMRNVDLPSGDYHFTMTVDDGARLYVDGYLLIDAWEDQPPCTYTGDSYLPGGSVTVQMEYYESRGDATAQLSWEEAAPPPPADGWKVYANESFGVTLSYPPHWQLVQGYGEPGEKFAREDGFFLISAMSGGAIDHIAATEAGHRLRPYGTQPTIESLQVQGQEARLILPSADQPPDMEDQAVLLARYSQPMAIIGYPCDFFVLYADQDHIRVIAETLSFTVNPAPASTVIVDDADAALVRRGSTTGWRTASEGHGDGLTWTYNNDYARSNYNWARWYSNVAARKYEVFVYIPDRYTTTSRAHYWVSHRDGHTLRVVDQSANGDRWVSLGTY
jgi:hypothetical protein